MSKLYAVVQVCPERHYDYKMDMIRESFSVGLPFVFSDRKRAYQEAEKKRKAHVPCFVKEFPYNPLDKRLETLEAKVKADADYIGDLEQSVKELEEENARLRSCLSDDAENARLRELVADMWNGMCGYEHDCRYCEHYELYAEQRFVGECEYHRRMRELGVKADA